MRNQCSMTLWRQLREKIWCMFVRVGRRNGLLRMVILAVTAVYLFCYHLYRKAKTVSAMRYACLCCAGILALNCVNAPVCVWSLEQETDSEAGADQSVESCGLKITIVRPDSPIIEGYQDTVPYRIKLENPEDGIDFSELKVYTSNYSDVYALVMNEETGAEEEVLVHRHLDEGTSETAGEPAGNLPEMLGELGEANSEEGNLETAGEPEGNNPEEGSLEEGNSGASEEPEVNDSEEGNAEEDNSETAGEPEGNNPEEGNSETIEELEGNDPEEGNSETTEKPDEDNSETAEEPEVNDSEEGNAEEDNSETAGEPEGNNPEEGNSETIEELEGNDPEEGNSETTEEPDEDNSETAGESEDSSEEGTQENEDEETQDLWGKSVAMPLARGETLTYIVRIPTGLQAGEYTETVIFQAEELIDPIKRNLSFIVESADKEGEFPAVTDPSEKDDVGEGDAAGETESGEAGDVTGEAESGEAGDVTGETESGEAGDVTGETESSEAGETTEEIETSEAGETTEETELSEAGETTEEIETSEAGETTEEIETTEEGEENEDLEEEPIPETKLEVISREGGYYMGNTFFAMSTAVYGLKVDVSEVSALFCDLNGALSELPVLDGYASFTVPEIYNGMIRFFALGQDDSVVGELTEYVIVEDTAPSLEYTNVISSTDGTCAVHVSLEDCGDIISGLNEMSCSVDGAPYTEYTPNVFGKVLLCSGEEVVSGFSFDILLQDNEVHTIEIIASDNVGNILEKSFRVNAPQAAVISVVLPTSFGMTMFPYASNENIWGEDIVVANQSEFPVEVTLKSTQVNINREGSDNGVKGAELNLNFRLSKGRSSALQLPEGYSMPEECFVLEPRNPETNAMALQNDSSEKTMISGDYAIANIRGTIAKGSEEMWRDGDITVALTFTFRRVEEPEDDENL